MRIDVHCHAHPDQYIETLERSGRYQVDRDRTGLKIFKEKGSRFIGITGPMSNIDGRIGIMDETEVDVQVLSVSCPNVYFLRGKEERDLARFCNDWLAEQVSKYPKRFRAFASIPMSDMEYARAELHRAKYELGMQGVILMSNVDGEPLNLPKFEPYFAEVDRLDFPIFLHPNVPLGIELMYEYSLAPMVGFIFDSTLAVARLIYAGYFEKYKNLRMIVPHNGSAVPVLTGRFNIGYRAYRDQQDNIPKPPGDYIKNLYCDTVGFHVPALMCTYQTAGPERMMLGTDSPHVIGDIVQCVQDIQRLEIPEDEKKMILGGNAQQFLGIE